MCDDLSIIPLLGFVKFPLNLGKVVALILLLLFVVNVKKLMISQEI
jgi:hypothetical protein